MTTNYDTLLERTTDLLTDKAYDVVRQVEEVPGASKPRIIKLHGSFPSTRPFIITEEDFRTYPKRFAAFVNLAQQIFMENVVCLVGFSGDDPNFLHWTGWVRDHLGRSAPQIYLCGLLKLNAAKRNLYHQRNVVPIDLAVLFENTSHHLSPALQHQKAMEWFLQSLSNDCPLSSRWPDRRSIIPIPIEGVFLLPLASSRPHLRKERREPPAPFQPSDLVAEVTTWITNRNLYPGWVIAPEETRGILFSNTKYWVAPLLNSLASLSPGQRLTVLHELCWRFDTALLPLEQTMADAIRQCLTDIPYDTISGIAPVDGFTPGVWESTHTCWVRLALSVLRFYREERSQALFEQWASVIGPTLASHPDERHRFHYEQCLAALGDMNDTLTLTVLAGWNADSYDPTWKLRRAAVLIEVGHIQEAETATRAALTAIRSQARPGASDIANLSREGLAMMQMFHIRQYFTLGQPEDVSMWHEYRDRWDKLTQYSCNPLIETDLLKSALEKQIVNDDDVSRNLPAYQFIRLTEEAPIPPRCGNFILSESTLRRAGEWLSSHDAVRTLTYCCRSASKEAFEAFLTRCRVALLPASTY